MKERKRTGSEGKEKPGKIRKGTRTTASDEYIHEGKAPDGNDQRIFMQENAGTIETDVFIRTARTPRTDPGNYARTYARNV